MSFSTQGVVYVFAGPNGAGKSTLWKTISPLVPRINGDDLLHKQKLSAFDVEAILQQQMLELVDARSSFVIETNLAAERDYDLLRSLKAGQYRVELRYIGLESVALCKQRVAERVQRGGHDVSAALVEHRYTNSLSLLKRFYPVFDRLELYDNTESFTPLFSKDAGQPMQLLHSPLAPWAQGITEHIARMEKIYQKLTPPAPLRD
jgi:predicted ABC-type ATPase